MTKINSSDDNVAALAGLAIIAILVAIPYGIFWNAIVGWQFWQWFLIPIGAPDISGWHIAGIMTLVSFVRYKVGEKSENDDSSFAAALAKVFIYPPVISVIYLLLGLLVAKLAGLA